MDYRIQGKILPRILDMEEYLQQLKKLESKVITTAPPLDQDSPKTLPTSPPMSLTPGTRTPWKNKPSLFLKKDNKLQNNLTIEIGGPKFSIRPK